jgi:hypothetical protein
LKEEAASLDSVQAGETPLAANDVALPETPMPSKTVSSQEEKKGEFLLSFFLCQKDWV